MPQSQTAALPRHQEEEQTDKTKQAQTKQTYEGELKNKKKQPNLFLGEINLFFFDVIAL